MISSFQIQARIEECLSHLSTNPSILKQFLQMGQLDFLIGHPSFSLDVLDRLIDALIPVEAFYQEMGGLAGYQKKVLSLLQKQDVLDSSCVYHSPAFIDISKLSPATEEWIDWGVDALAETAEMIPLGGSADRLHLACDVTGVELPAAKLQFGRKSLLTRLIQDIQAREHLYFLKYKKKIITPIAMMSSWEKDNHFHIEQILKENQWFGRPKESFRIFTQPLVPVVDEKGDWIFSSDLNLVMKPGGHGAIWKMAIDTGVFSWFESLGKKKVLVRQINNPIAGLDYGLLAFLGIGWKQNKKFGFASCPRLLRSAEGVNVLVEKENSIVLTSIEYCDFEKFGIEDLPLKEGAPFSKFSSNTNLLFGDLSSLREAVKKCPYPGLLLNLKKGSFANAKGDRREAVCGRLESTMQNIADVFEETTKGSLTPEDTFITYNVRHKTISTTKRAYVKGGLLQETPESCFYDLLFSARELLESKCSFLLPSPRSLEEYLEKGPEFVFLYHPTLGPLYSIIQQKIQGGVLSKGSELELEICDLFIKKLHLDGSLRIFSGLEGKCEMRNVTVRNRGVNWEKSSPFWKGNFVRSEGVKIILKGRSRFVAEDVELDGSFIFEVEDGECLHVKHSERGVVLLRSEFSRHE